ncbi:hypothetical protein FHS35_005435 [Streptomyces umbrinus]|nr:hypothetical protein [Streptomyces umbrinus]
MPRACRLVPTRTASTRRVTRTQAGNGSGGDPSAGRSPGPRKRGVHEHGSAPRLHSSSPLDAPRAALGGERTGRTRPVRAVRGVWGYGRHGQLGYALGPCRRRGAREPGPPALARRLQPCEVGACAARARNRGCSAVARSNRRRRHGSAAEAHPHGRAAEARQRGDSAGLRRAGHTAPAARFGRDRPSRCVLVRVVPLPQPPSRRRTATRTGDTPAAARFGTLPGHPAARHGCPATRGTDRDAVRPAASGDRPTHHLDGPVGPGERGPPTTSGRRSRGDSEACRTDRRSAASGA